MCAGRTCGHDGMIGPLQAMRNRHVSRCQIDQAAGNEEWRDAARPPLFQHDSSLGNAGETTDPGPDHHPGIDLILMGYRLPAGVGERLLGGCNRKDDEVIDLALFLRLHPLVGVEAIARTVAARNLAGDLGRQIGDVERLDAPCPAVAIDQASPGRLDAASERRHHAKPCDDDASHLRLHRARSAKVEAGFATSCDSWSKPACTSTALPRAAMVPLTSAKADPPATARSVPDNAATSPRLYVGDAAGRQGKR